MSIDEIKELMRLMSKAGMKKLLLKRKDGSEIHLEKACHEPIQPIYSQMQAPHFQHPPIPASLPPVISEPSQNADRKSHVGLDEIASPLVGTFYSSPSPDKPAFVAKGDSIAKGQVLCIIEAMKVMNEIKSDIEGTIVEILVNSGDPVEFGKPLFQVKPK